MRRFEQLEELFKSLGLDSYEKKYVDTALTEFLECEGSDNVVYDDDDEPLNFMSVEIKFKKYNIGVTSVIIDEECGTYKNYFWLEGGISTLEGRKWGELTENEREYLLKETNTVDATGNNVKNGECIIDMADNLSVFGIIKNDELIINDEEIIYNPTK